jgi:hypothetical protein
MGKKPFIGLAALLLAGVAITATGCGQCTSCNTRPGKFNPGPMSKGPTPAVGDKKTKTEVAADSSIPPAPTPVDTTSGGGPSLPPPGTGTASGSLKKDTPPVTPVSMDDNVPGRDPLEGSTVSPSRPSSTTSFPVPPTPVRSTLGGASRSIPATPMGRAPELPTNTTTDLPRGVMPSGSPPVPTPPVGSTPPPPAPLAGGETPPPLPGTSLPGTSLPPLQN